MFGKTTLIILILGLFAFAANGQVYEIYEGDTINKVTKTMKKIGFWKYFYDKTKTQIKSEGLFTDNNKEGIWISYYEDGTRKSEITYRKNRPIGPARFYYENGYIKEEGEWLIKHWIGSYKYCHENGNPSYEFFYDAEGNRTGEQYYYYETGELMITGKWEAGKKTGILTEFHTDGSVKNEKIFNDGKIIEGQSKEYAEGAKDGGEIFKKKSKKLLFTGDFRKTSPEGLLLQRGYFVDGELINGKWYFYDINGNLYKTKVLKNKQVIEVIYPQ